MGIGAWAWWADRAPEAARLSSSKLDDLARTIGAQRPLAPRLAGEFAYSPLPQGAPMRRTGTFPELLDAITAWRLENRPADGERLRSDAWIRLLTDPDTAALELAVDELEIAVLERPGDPDALNDLGVAYLALAVEDGRPDHLPRAFGALRRALELEPELAEAWFNRALLLERLALHEAARESWQHYLDLDASSGWADEARGRLESLDLQATQRAQGWPATLAALEEAARVGDLDTLRIGAAEWKSATRRQIESWLVDWARQHTAGDAVAAGQSLALAQAFANALAEVSPERALAVIVADVHETVQLGNTETLADALRAYGDGLDLYGDERYRDAVDVLGEAARDLRTLGSRFASRAEHFAASALRFVERIPESAERFAILADTLPEDAVFQRGDALWLLGITRLQTGQPQAGLDAFRAAVPVLEALGDPDQLAGIHLLLAESAQLYGESRLAWHHLGQALERVHQMRRPERRELMSQIAAELASAAGEPTLTLLYREASLQRALPANRGLSLAFHHLDRARAHLALGNLEPVRADLEEARNYGEALPDVQSRSRILAERLLLESRVAEDPGSGLAAIDQALALFDAQSFALERPAMLLAKARLARDAGDPAGAIDALATGLQIFENERQDLLDHELRTSYAEHLDEIFTLLAGMHRDRGSSNDALHVLEQRRARELLGHIAHLGKEPLPGALSRRALAPAPSPPTDWHEELPEDVTLLSFGVLDGRLDAWVLDHREIRSEELAEEWRPLAEQVERFRDLVRRNARQAERDYLAIELGARLLGPALRSAEPGGRVVVVPDGVLHGLPWAALRSADGELLIARYRLTVAPSLAFWRLTAQRRRQLEVGEAAPGGHDVLVVGNPTLGREQALLYRGRDLEAAEREARDVASLYGAEPTLGAAATEGRFRELAKDAAIIHFAGHATARLDAPLRSHLSLASSVEDSDDGVLHAYELYGLTLPRARLVVLSACSTAGGPHGAEGVESLAQAFLATGAPGVVASLWDVRDGPTAELMLRFHKELRAGAEVAEALRRAQLSMAQDADPALASVSTWAAFQLLGDGPAVVPGTAQEERRNDL